MTAAEQTKAALISGAARGIGRATADLFSDRGYATVGFDVADEELARRAATGRSRSAMCSWRSLLILSSMAARVVDFPDPVGPVTRTRPRGLSQIVATTGGRLSSLKLRIS